MSISENIGRKTSELGSIKLPERREDFRPEEQKLLLCHQDHSNNLDLLSDVKPSDTIIEQKSEKDLLWLKSKLLD